MRTGYIIVSKMNNHPPTNITQIIFFSVSSLTFSYIQKSYYTIRGVSDMKTVDSDTYFETNGMSIKYDLAGSMVSEIKVNSQTGWVNESVIEQKMSGTAYILDSPKMPGGLEMPMSFTTTIAVTGK